MTPDIETELGRMLENDRLKKRVAELEKAGQFVAQIQDDLQKAQSELHTYAWRLEGYESALKEARVALDFCIGLIDHANRGAFENGVTDSTGTIDEGEVVAGNCRQQAQDAIATIKKELGE